MNFLSAFKKMHIFTRSPHRLPVDLHPRTFIDAPVKWVRDRGLDHAVEKEKHLLPFINVKDLLISSPTPSLPLSSIAPHSSSLLLPFRPLRFLRLFPSSFVEHFPPDSPHHPHFQPSPPLLELHDQEKSISISPSLLPDSADRLLHLLMLCPLRRLPLHLIHRLRFDLGLPLDFPSSLLPLFPDYFQLSPSKSSPSDLDLDLVCYRKDLAVSALELRAARAGGYQKGAALAFPLQFSRGFDLEKKVRKWVEEWQRLPYVSPYEDGSCLPQKSDVWEKWAVGMVHELLSLMVGKKVEMQSLGLIAQHVGLPCGFRKMIMNHPGIFYMSNKLRTQTVVLREAYRRDLLVENHPLMGLRYQYIHLMRKEKEGSGNGKKTKKSKKLKREDKRVVDVGEDEDEEEDDEEEEEGDEYGEISGASDIDSEDEESDDEESDDDEDVDYDRKQESAHVEEIERRRPPRDMNSGKCQSIGIQRNDRSREDSVRGRPPKRGNPVRTKHGTTSRRCVSS